MRIAERHDRLVEEHEFEDDRRAVAQHHVGLLQKRHLVGTLIKYDVLVLLRNTFIAGYDPGVGQLGMERDDPVPRMGFGQTVDLRHQMGRRTDIAREGRGVKNHWMVILRFALHFGREIGVGFGPAGLVDPEEAVFLFQFLEIRRAARPLRTIDVEPSTHREVVVDGLDPLLNRIAVEKRHLHARDKIGDIIARCKNRDRVISDRLPDCPQPHLALFEHDGTPLFDKPGRLASAAADFMFQRPQDRIGIRQSNVQQVSFHRSRFRLQHSAVQCASRRFRLFPQRIRVETASTPGRIHRRLSILSSNRSQRLKNPPNSAR